SSTVVALVASTSVHRSGAQLAQALVMPVIHCECMAATDREESVCTPNDHVSPGKVPSRRCRYSAMSVSCDIGPQLPTVAVGPRPRVGARAGADLRGRGAWDAAPRRGPGGYGRMMRALQATWALKATSEAVADPGNVWYANRKVMSPVESFLRIAWTFLCVPPVLLTFRYANSMIGFTRTWSKVTISHQSHGPNGSNSG